MTSPHSAKNVQTVTMRTSNVLRNGKVEVTLQTGQVEVRTTCSPELAILLNDPATDPLAVQIFVQSLLKKAARDAPSHEINDQGSSVQDIGLSTQVNLPSDQQIGLSSQEIGLSAQGVNLPSQEVKLPSQEVGLKSQEVRLPSQEAGPSTPEAGPSSQFLVRTWTTNAEKCLVVAFQKSDSGKGVKNRWSKIAGVMDSYGCHFSSEQCRLKYKGLKERHERQKKKNRSSGESPAEEDDIYEMFEEQVDMNPPHILESSPGLKRKSTLSDPSDSDKLETISAKPDSPASNKGKRKKTDSVSTTLTTLFREREEVLTTRHQEKMDAVKSLIDVLKQLVDK